MAVSKTRKTINKETKPKKDMLQCIGGCGNLYVKNSTKFYTSSRLEYNNATCGGFLNICKSCLTKMCYQEGDLNILCVKDVLRKLNKPFKFDIYRKVISEGISDSTKDVSSEFSLGNYIKYLNLSYKGQTFDDSDKEDKTLKEIIKSEYMDEKTFDYKEDNSFDIKKQQLDMMLTRFKITYEMIERWGTQYEKADYIKLEDFYQKMKSVNSIETPQDEFYLKKLSVISLKLDEELNKGNYSQAKQLGDLFSKYMADSKFRAMDKTDADKTGGIRNFGQIYAEVEKDGFIPPWEYYRKLKGITQDLVDKTIMHIENFTLRLNKVETMTIPPIDTPKIDNNEVDSNG